MLRRIAKPFLCPHTIADDVHKIPAMPFSLVGYGFYIEMTPTEISYPSFKYI